MRLLRLLTIPFLGFLKSGPDPSSSSIGANEEVRLRKEGVSRQRRLTTGAWRSIVVSLISILGPANLTGIEYTEDLAIFLWSRA
ncbi:hypothetical protein KC330_g91 [Hortaea werneckii]|nr:hypothetical protein KC330_g91 [Hortaea werneckii]